jgi:PQQ-dependent catabolism-associated beta-propeller protein
VRLVMVLTGSVIKVPVVTESRLRLRLNVLNRLVGLSRVDALTGRALAHLQSITLGLAILVGAACLPLAAHEVYVSNEKDNTISVIDTEKLEVVRTFAVGERPRGITFSKDFKQFFVCASDSDAVQVYDSNGEKHLYDLPSGADPEQFAVSPDNKRLYIANEDNAITTIVDLETRRVIEQVDVGVEPEGMAVSPDNKLAVTTSETTNMAHFIDTETFDVIANVIVDARPRDAEFTPDGSKVWVSSEIGGTVSIIDVAAKKIEHVITFEIPGISIDLVQPVGMLINKDASMAFVALGPANRVAVVDMKTLKVLKYILVGRRVWHLAMTPEEDLLFSTNGITNDVTAIDVKSLKAIKSIPVGRYPWGAAIRPSNPSP